MPVPWSATEILTYLPSGNGGSSSDETCVFSADIISIPQPGIASTELRTIVLITRPICSPSAST